MLWSFEVSVTPSIDLETGWLLSLGQCERGISYSTTLYLLQMAPSIKIESRGRLLLLRIGNCGLPQIQKCIAMIFLELNQKID